MNTSLRNRRNRKDTTKRFTEQPLGAAVSAGAYGDEVRWVEIYVPIPGTPADASEMGGVLGLEERE